MGVTGNNYYKKIENPNHTDGTIGSFHFINDSVAWYSNSIGTSILINDSITAFVKTPLPSPYHYTVGTNKTYYFHSKNQLLYVSEFNGLAFSNPIIADSFQVDLKHHFVVDPKKRLWLFQMKQKAFTLHHWDTELKKFTLSKSFSFPIDLFLIGLTDEYNFIGFDLKTLKVYQVKNGQLIPTKYQATCGPPGSICTDHYFYPLAISRDEKNINSIVTLTHPSATLLQFSTQTAVIKILPDESIGAYYGFTNNKPVLISGFLKKFPNILNGTGSDIFALNEGPDGTIWAASYKGGIAVLKNDTLVAKVATKNTFLNGGSTLNNHFYFIGETKEKGLLQIDNAGKITNLTPGTVGYSVYITKNKKNLFYGTANYNGIWFTSSKLLDKGVANWTKIDSSKGIKLQNIITITEDKKGRIWTGHPKKGIAIYDPQNNTARTWLKETGATAIGTYASVTDNRGTVWLGTANAGLWYYNNYNLPAAPGSCQQIKHPLLNHSTTITAFTIYKEWLIIAATDKILLLNIDSFNTSGKILMRYINPIQTGFTGVTEQNTLLTSQKEAAIWFSTTDMVYKWSIDKWLQLPTYNVFVNTYICTDSKKWKLGNDPIVFNPGFNSFDIKINYQSKDNLPRYISAQMIKDKDTTILSLTSLQSAFSFKNLEGGNYRFIFTVCEANGSTSTYNYSITLQKYAWQYWWFWAIISLLIIGIITLFVTIKKKKQLAELKAKAYAAELQSLKDLQEKEMANLRLVSLSSQFRPHFILNALNTIGAQMDDKPDAETVLSRLGESVNLIFNHAIQQKTLHSLENEWTLVTNIIKIHQLMYLKELEILLPELSEIRKHAQMLIPMGALQIPVENALLHGLSNRSTPPWQLSIVTKEKETGLEFIITDNGVGRIKSMKLSNHTKHGTGTKNLQETIRIINSINLLPLTIAYKDELMGETNEKYGTQVTIFIPYSFKYES